MYAGVKPTETDMFSLRLQAEGGGDTVLKKLAARRDELKTVSWILVTKM